MNNINEPKTHIYDFDRFRLVPTEKLLLFDGMPLNPSPKVFEVLVELVVNHGRLVSKDELLNQIWGDTFVEEATLARTVSNLRKILRENSELNYIETVAKSGYRFTDSVPVFEEVRELSTSQSSDQPMETIVTELLFADNSFGKIDKTANNLIKTKWYWDLRVKLILILMIVAMAVGINYLWTTSRNVKKVSSIKSIAVLPFRFIGGSESGNIYGSGMAETLIIKLNSINQIIVRPSSAVSKYAAQENLDLMSIGRELKVDATLIGTIQRDGERFRVSVQLVNSEDGESLWAEYFDAESKDIFTLQDDISSRVTQTLRLELSGKDANRLVKRYTENTEAYEAYITGRFLLSRRNPVDFMKSLEYFQKAIETDSNYALAYTGVADCYHAFAEYRMIPVSEAFAKARTAARKALELDETLSEAHSSLAYTLAIHDWDFEAAEKEFKRAIELNPNYANAHQWFFDLLVIQGRFDEAWKEIRRAEELDPASLGIKAEFASYYFLTKQYDKAIEESKKLIELEPKYPFGYIFLLVGYREKGNEKEEVETFLKVAETFYGNGESEIEELRNSYNHGGLKGFCLKRIEQMDKDSDRNVYLAWDYAGFFIRLGDRENAIKWLKKSYQNRDRWITSIKYDPVWNPIRSDPRFEEIVKQIGLE